MANICTFTMKIIGYNKESIEQFAQMLTYSHPNGLYFARIFDAYMYDEEEKDGKFIAYISGSCAWSVNACMCNTIFSYYRDNCKKDNEITNLSLQTKRLNLIVEIYSEESGMGFAEHIIYNKGKEIINEATDFSECWYDEYESMDDFMEDNNLDLTKEEQEYVKENGYITIGGFKGEFTI